MRALTKFLLVVAVVFAIPVLHAEDAWKLPKPPKGFEYVNCGNQFQIALPKGQWEWIPVQGIDSYVGKLQVKKFRLTFDFGMYSPSPAIGPEVVVSKETLCTKVVTITFPKKSEKGAVELDIKLTDDRRLHMGGYDLSKRDQELVLKIFRSIQFHPWYQKQ